MVSVHVEMEEVGVRLTFDASRLTDDGVKQVVARTFREIQRTLIADGDVRNMRVLRSEGTTVRLDPETRHAECHIPFMEIRVQTTHVPGVPLHARVVGDQTTASPEVADAVCAAVNQSLGDASSDTGGALR